MADEQFEHPNHLIRVFLFRVEVRDLVCGEFQGRRCDHTPFALLPLRH